MENWLTRVTKKKLPNVTVARHRKKREEKEGEGRRRRAPEGSCHIIRDEKTKSVAIEGNILPHPLQRLLQNSHLNHSGSVLVAEVTDHARQHLSVNSVSRQRTRHMKPSPKLKNRHVGGKCK